MIIKPKKLDDVLTFGKYKGYSIQYVLNVNASYLLWAHNNIEWFKLNKSVLDEVINKAYNERMEYALDHFDWGIDPYDWCD